MCHPMYTAICPVISMQHSKDAQIRANIDKNGVFRKLIFSGRFCRMGIGFIVSNFLIFIISDFLIELLRVKHPGCGQCAIDSVNGRGYYSA